MCGVGVEGVRADPDGQVMDVDDGSAPGSSREVECFDESISETGMQLCQRRMSGQFGSDNECSLFFARSFRFDFGNRRRVFGPASDLILKYDMGSAARAANVWGVWSEEGCRDWRPDFTSEPPSIHSYYTYSRLPRFLHIFMTIVLHMCHRPVRMTGCARESWDTVVSTAVGSRH